MPGGDAHNLSPKANAHYHGPQTHLLIETSRRTSHSQQKVKSFDGGQSIPEGEMLYQSHCIYRVCSTLNFRNISLKIRSEESFRTIA